MGGQCCREPGDPEINDSWKGIIFDEEKIIDDEYLFQVSPVMGREKLHRSICAIRFKNSASKFGVGSGILLSRNIVLTAAHIIYDKIGECEYNKDGYAVYVGAVGQAETYYEVQDWRYPDEYRSCEQDIKLKSDFALLKLSKEVSCEEFVEVSLPCECIFSKREEIKLKIYGYPHRNNYKLLDESGKRIKLSQFGRTLDKSIVNVEADKFVIAHKVSTLSGQSGCPIVVDDRIIAIHTGAAKEGDEFNIGRLITQGLITHLKQWIGQLIGKPIKISENMSCSLCAPPLPPPPVAVSNHADKTPQQKQQLAEDLYNIARRYYGSTPPQYTSALNYFLKSQEILVDLEDDSVFLAEVKQKIGLMYAYIKNVDKAFKYFGESQQIYEKREAKSKYQFGTLQLNMGVFNAMNLHYKSALPHLESALKVFNGLQDQHNIKESAKWLAKVLIKLNEMEKLEKIIRKYEVDPAEIQ